jgi:hypothetical protein
MNLLPPSARRSNARAFIVTLLLGGLVLASGAGASAPAADTVPGAPWVRVAQNIDLPSLKQGVRKPEVLLYSDSYIYGPSSGFGSDPELTLTVAPNTIDGAVTLWVYWVNRETDQVRYYNLSQGWVSQATDLFGQGSGPVRVLVPELEDFPLFGAGSALGPLSGVPSTTGRYMVVFEIRDAAGSEPLARDAALYNFVDSLVTVSGNLPASTTWTNNNAYFLGGPTRVTDGSSLTIQKGTVVLGSQAGTGLLNVRQGGQIFAVGEADDPIVMTSEFVRDERGTGDWGGLVVNGRAPVNNAEGGALPLGEGDSGPYGGNQANDNSGRLEFLRVEFAGVRFTDENELNGIALQGVGSGTVLSNIQVIGGSDDGIEFFGGTADIENALVYNVEDDALDWTFGWNGTATNICLLQTTAGNERSQLIESDGNEQNNSAEPRSNPNITNFLAWSGKFSASDSVLFRRGTWVRLTNAAIGGTVDPAIVIDGAESQQAVADGNIVFTDVIVQNTGGISNIPVTGVTVGNPGIANPISPIHPDLTPLSGNNSCTTRNDDWTQEPWVNWDRGANN